MRINIIAFIIFIGGLNCTNSSFNKKESTVNITNNTTAETDNLPIIKFEKEIHNFGLIQQGEKVSYTFKFKNIGSGDLIINDASASCGCTVPKFSREPIGSGESGEIEVIFDTHRRSGNQSKSVTVWTNCEPNKIKLRITAEIPIER